MGCGLLYCLAFLGLGMAGPGMREILRPEYMPWVLLLTSTPHYGATLLRVYRQRSDRRRYAVFGVWATAAVWAIFAVGVYHVAVGSLLVTVYLTWSPWHYSGQNYGIAVLFLRRRGVPLTAWSKRLFQASFFLSFLLTVIAFHGERQGDLYAPGEYQLAVYELMTGGIPHAWVTVLMPVCAVAYLACLGGAVVCFLRVAKPRDLMPSLVLAGSQALWFSIPVLARYGNVLQGVEPLSNQHAAYAFLWVAVAHATQYVWITSYYARRVASPPSRSRYLTQTLLAGAAIWVVPTLLFAPGVLGTVSFDAGLAVLVAAAVNIHHFILDGAIWKLRDGRIAKILLRGQTDDDSGAAATTRALRAGTWVRRSIWATGVVSVAILALGTFERVVNVAGAARRADDALAAGDRDGWRDAMGRIEAAQRRLWWMGRESSRVHIELAMKYLAVQDDAGARRHAEAAARQASDWYTLANLGIYYQRTQQWDRALSATERANELKPDNAQVASTLAWMLLQRRRSDPASVARAIDLAEQSVRAEEKARSLYYLALAYEAGGRVADALEAARSAEQKARVEGIPQLAEFTRFRQQLERR